MASVRSKTAKQRGYVLVAVMLLMTLMLLTLSIELPRIGQQIRREKEEELIHRGNEYRMAIRRFYRKNARYPLTLDDLEKANNIRYLRKRYKDPFTGKDDWRLLHVGEVVLNVTGGSSTLGSGPGTSGIGTSGIGTPNPGATPGGTAPGGTNPSAQPGGQPGGIGQPVSSMGGSSPLSTGGPIIGVASTKKDVGIKEIDQKEHYNEWLFYYDVRQDQQQPGAVPNPVPNVNGPPPPATNPPPTTPPPPGGRSQ